MSLRRSFAPLAALLVAGASTVLLSGCAASGSSSEPTGPSTSATTPAAAAKSAAPAARSAKGGPLEIVSAQFGVFGADPSGRRVLFETDTFPAITAAPYGWYIIFKTDKPTVVWREEFELPLAPPTWGPGEAMGIFTISPDRKTAVTERIVPTRVGFIANEWRYAPGDPIGKHAMRVYIDGQLVKDFRFAIEDGPGTQECDPHQGMRRGPGRGPST
jgi:hypothetical protein